MTDTNLYFDTDNYTALTKHTLGRAEAVNAVIAAIVTGFDGLPTPTQLKQATHLYSTVGGTADVITVTSTFPIASYVAGMRRSILIVSSNTGAATVNFDTIGAKAIKRWDGTDLSAADLLAGMVADLEYQGTYFQLMNPIGSLATAAATSATAAASSASSASTSASAASTSASSAATSASAAAASAATVPTYPSLAGNGLRYPRLAAGETAMEFRTASQTRTDLSLVPGTDVQVYDVDLAAIAALSSTGLIAHTGAGTAAERTITGTAAEITVSNGNGVSGNPTLSLPSALTFTGKTVTGGTFAGTTQSGSTLRTGDPCFLAIRTTNDANATGNGFLSGVSFDTEVLDRGSNFAGGTTFTAPVTGAYQLSLQVALEDLTTVMTAFQVRLITSNKTYIYDIRFTPIASGSVSLPMNVTCDMDAADTATVSVIASNGAGNTADISGSGTNALTFFSGHLIG